MTPKKLIIVFFLLGSTAIGQVSNFGWQAGLNFSFGTHTNRVGIMGAGFYGYDFAQVNASLNLLYNFQSFALKKKTPEIQTGIGVQFGFANELSDRNGFIGLMEQNTDHSCAIGYSYLYYWDKNETSQATGMFTVDLWDFKFVTENDLFAGGKGWRDRYRTGTFYVEYQYDSLKFGLVTLFWTGDYVGCDVVNDDPDYESRWGYRLNEKAKYGNTTVGLLYGSIRYLGPLQQIPQIRLGIDSEHIRNAMQNKLIHNAPFAPDFMMKREVYQIPMLMENGEQYLYKEGQKVKPARLYFELGLNEMPFY
ncbi:MAG: polymorphic toxin type 23 domain-containing protein [Crocinitomicaceae bacterium]|nr:polymorphic toxin type 23 domain-containing protein [Crocinitomicaceae bacterium]